MAGFVQSAFILRLKLPVLHQTDESGGCWSEEATRGAMRLVLLQPAHISGHERHTPRCSVQSAPLWAPPASQPGRWWEEGCQRETDRERERESDRAKPHGKCSPSLIKPCLAALLKMCDRSLSQLEFISSRSQIHQRVSNWILHIQFLYNMRYIHI